MSNEPDEVNSGALATMLGILAIATLAVALVVTALVRNERTELLAEKDLSQEHAFRKLRAEQLVSLSGSPSWSDQEHGLAKISIERSMELVVNEVRRNPYALTPAPPKKEEDEEDAGAEGEASAEAESEAGAEADPQAETTGGAEQAAKAIEGGKAGAVSDAKPTQKAPSPKVEKLSPKSPVVPPSQSSGESPE